MATRIGLVLAGIVIIMLMLLGSRGRAEHWARIAPVDAFDATPRGGRVLAISANPAANSRDSLSGLRLAVQAGERGDFVSYTWSALEPGTRRYALDDLGGGMDYLGRRLRHKLLLGIQVLNTTAKETPADLAGLAFDSETMKTRFRDLLRALRPHLNHNVAYLSIGNEVDVYLSTHPAEWQPYSDFYRFAAAEARKLAPWIKVGVTVTFDDARLERRHVDALTAASDVTMLTYYPLAAHFMVRDPHAPLGDLPTMLRLSEGRPLILQEVGYPTAARLGSSPAKQATFVRSVYTAWARAGGRIPFLNFFELHDGTPGECRHYGDYYGLRDPNFLAYLCSLGLRTANGRPKPAWDAFRAGAALVSRHQ